MSCYHLGQASSTISYRLKRNNEWSSWSDFTQQHEFVANDRFAYQAKPIYSSFSAVQFRTNQQLDELLNIRFFLAENKNGPAPSMTTMQRSVNCDSPEVCDRTCWCPSCPIDNTPQITEPTHLIVHHSAGNNQSNDFGQVVEFIWDLHVNTNGWDDIGYNWLIDPNGILYQGRPDNYQGAHFSCINENTVGICVIGDYSLVEPSEEAINTLINTLAFEATEHLIDVNIQSQHETGEFLLDNIAGHRDSSGSMNACSGTECPGNSFYPLLPEIRLIVAELPCYQAAISSVYNIEQLQVKIYPNPSSDFIYIESLDQKIRSFEIVDVQGRSVGYFESEEQLDINQLSLGIYYLMFEGRIIQTLIKS